MKSEQEIFELRERVIKAAVPFAKRHKLPWVGAAVSSEQAHYFAMGAIAFASDVLELKVHGNIENYIVGVEQANAAGR